MHAHLTWHWQLSVSPIQARLFLRTVLNCSNLWRSCTDCYCRKILEAGVLVQLRSICRPSAQTADIALFLLVFLLHIIVYCFVSLICKNSIIIITTIRNNDTVRLYTAIYEVKNAACFSCTKHVPFKITIIKCCLQTDCIIVAYCIDTMGMTH